MNNMTTNSPSDSLHTAAPSVPSPGNLRKRLKDRVRPVVRVLRPPLTKLGAQLLRAFGEHCCPMRVDLQKPLCRDFRLLMMTGRPHLPMLRHCLHSLCHSWTSLPVLRVVSDGTLTPEELRHALQFYPGPMETIGWLQILEQLKSRHYASLVEYAERHSLGKKLLIILHSAASGTPTLWCDADFLWFRPLPERWMPAIPTPGVAMTEDCCCCYDSQLLGIEPRLQPEAPFYNSGLLLAQGNLIDDPVVHRMAKIASANPHWFSEQTIFSTLAARHGKPTWSKEQVFISVQYKNSLSLTPSYRYQSWLAHHYAAARPQFWRDAVSLYAEQRRAHLHPNSRLSGTIPR